MQMTTDKISNVTVVTVPGPNLDAANHKEFKAHLAEIVKENSRIVLDLKELEFIDSSGLGAILSCFRQVNAVGGDLKLCNMNDSVRILFELVRMHRVFEIYGTCEEAVAVFG